MTMDLDGHVFKFPGRSFRYWNAIAESDTSGFATALDALDVLRADWEPLSAEAVVTCVDPEGAEEDEPARPHWLLSRAALPPNVIVASLMVDPIQTQAQHLSRPTLERWLSGALADCGCQKPGWRPEWSQLRFAASRTRVGPHNWRGNQDVVRLRTDAGILTAPLERDEQGTWISGPRNPAFDQPALGVDILQRWGTLTFDINVNFSYWLDDSEPAAVQLKAVRTRLEALGWKAG
jgi:hypothetical protein